LTEVLPTSLEDYFNRDPLELTRADRDTIVAYFRNARETFLKQDATKAARPKATKAAPKVALPAELTAADLDLDLGV